MTWLIYNLSFRYHTDMTTKGLWLGLGSAKVEVLHIQYFHILKFTIWARVMGFNATFNNILVRSVRSVLLVEETVVPGENHWPAVSHWQTLSHNVVSSTPRLIGINLQYEFSFPSLTAVWVKLLFPLNHILWYVHVLLCKHLPLESTSLWK